MGSKISIDKHISSLDDILDMSPTYFSKVKFESKISSDITQHLKVLSLHSLIERRFGNSAKARNSWTQSGLRQCRWPTCSKVGSTSDKMRLTCCFSFTNQANRVPLSPLIPV